MDQPTRPRRSAGDLAAWGGVVGPAVFVADWAVLGVIRAGYSPVADAISRLAETGASTRPEMTGGFLVYGIGLIGYGTALRQAVPGSAWRWAVGTGLTTLGVAAFPLGTPTSGNVHAVFAALGYVGLAAIPVAAAARLRDQGHRSWARLSVLTGGLTGVFLLASIFGGPTHGLTQRIGLTVGDTWVALSAVALLSRGRRGRRRPPRRDILGHGQYG